MKKSDRTLPFPVGTSSYIIPADILPNVDFLKDKVDDIELVLFESADASNIPSQKVIGKLADYARQYNLTYTVHLPYDVKAASCDENERLHALDTWVRIMEITRELPVHGYIVHIEPERYRNDDGTPCLEPSSEPEKWTALARRSMNELRERTSALIRPELICVETLSYNLMPLLPDIIANGFSVTLDVGHLWLNGLYSPDYVRKLLPHTRIVHLHGVRGLEDHGSLEVSDRELLLQFFSLLGEFPRRPIVVTLEIFSEADLNGSLSVMREMGVIR